MESMLPSLGDDLCAKLAVAKFCVERGKYNSAVDLLHNILKKETVDDGDDNFCDEMEVTTMLGKALRGDGRVQSEDEELKFMDITRVAGAGRHCHVHP